MRISQNFIKILYYVVDHVRIFHTAYLVTSGTGEVACFGRTPYEAYLKAWLSAGYTLPTKTILVSIGPEQQKEEFLPWASVRIDGDGVVSISNRLDFDFSRVSLVRD